PPGIKEVACHVALRLVQGPGQHELGRIDVLRPPAGIAPRAAAVAYVAREVPDRRGEAHLEPGIAALQPVVQPVRVPVHRGPALERQIGDEEDASHREAFHDATTPCCTSARVAPSWNVASWRRATQFM